MNQSDETIGGESFEASLDRLQAIVGELEDGNLGLEHSLSHFEEGVRLLRSCYQFLEYAEQRIEVLTRLDTSGDAVTAPFDATATAETPVAKRPGRRGTRNREEPPGPSADEPTPGEQRLF